MLYERITCIRHYFPRQQNGPESIPGQKAETAHGLCASRESHPSEDLSELPPLRLAVAGQEYHVDAFHRIQICHDLFHGVMDPLVTLKAALMQISFFCTGESSRILQSCSPLSAARQRMYFSFWICSFQVARGGAT